MLYLIEFKVEGWRIIGLCKQRVAVRKQYYCFAGRLHACIRRFIYIRDLVLDELDPERRKQTVPLLLLLIED